MIRSDLGVFYKKRQKDFETTLEKIRGEINTISNLRLLVAILFLAAIYFTFSNVTFALAAVPLLMVFISLVLKHNSLHDQKTHLENLVKINHLESQSLEGNNSGFSPGTEFIDPHHPYTHDLDIFGDGSLFQAVNRANTINGKLLMAQRLSNPLTTHAEIASHQEAVRELASKTDFRQHFLAAGMEMDEQRYDREQLLEWVRLPPFLYGSSRIKIMLTLLPIITIAAVVLAFIVPAAKPFAIGLALLQWTVLGLHSKKLIIFTNTSAGRKTSWKNTHGCSMFLERKNLTRKSSKC